MLVVTHQRRECCQPQVAASSIFRGLAKQKGRPEGRPKIKEGPTAANVAASAGANRQDQVGGFGLPRGRLAIGGSGSPSR
jgi:hypothetical protein